MRKFNRLALLSLAAVALSLSACSKDEGGPTPEGKLRAREALQGLSFQDTMLTKYERAELVCELRAQYAPELLLMVEPNAVIRFNLKSANQVPDVLTAEATTGNHTLKAEVRIQKMGILSSFLYRDTDNSEYRMEFTPYIEAAFSFNWVTKFSDGQSNDGGSVTQDLINERIKNPVLNVSRKIEGETLGYFDHVSCSIETTAKPEFAHQFEIFYP